MQRLLIIGCSGSGKSTLARQLAERTGLPLIHLDQEYFGPDWAEPKQADWAKTVAQLAARDRWIMDGNFAATFKYRMPRADTIIFLDEPTWRCLWRVIWRTFRFHGRVRPDAAVGCPERFNVPFLKYVARYNNTRRSGILRTLAEQATRGKKVYILTGNKERELSTRTELITPFHSSSFAAGRR